MTKLGDIIVVDQNEDGNGGSAAIVTYVHEDGAVNLRVLSDGITGDEHRTLVTLDDAEPEHDLSNTQPLPAPAAEPSPPPPTP